MTDYAFYTDSYHGSSIPYEEWPAYSTRAEDQIARYKRIYTVTVPDELPDGESLAVCAIADALYGFDLIASGEAGPVQSAAIGSVSVSYGAPAQTVDLSPKGQAQELYRCAIRYLNIYRGAG